jgi:hypothetical protein
VVRPTQQPTGVYCFVNLPFQPRAIMAAPQGVGLIPDAGTITYANIPAPDLGQAGCDFGVPNVVVVSAPDNERTDGPFWVWFED